MATISELTDLQHRKEIVDHLTDYLSENFIKKDGQDTPKFSLSVRDCFKSYVSESMITSFISELEKESNDLNEKIQTILETLGYQ